jgi:hypothetical protein
MDYVHCVFNVQQVGETLNLYPNTFLISSAQNARERREKMIIFSDGVLLFIIFGF